MAPSGLESSIWASHGRFGRHRYDMRSRSMPPEPQQQQSSTTTLMETTTTAASPPTASPPTVAPAETTATNIARAASAISPALAFHRFEQACQRLRWKYIDLENSYKRALSPEEWMFSVQDAERNFKVDFYEFYAWIEQTLVLALLVFGIVVSREKRTVNGRVDDARGGGFKGFAAHSYHHNVLRALDEEDNPLHSALGAGDVNHALWKAKELRNRWKDAAEGRETPPLKMYDLTWIVTTILNGLEVTYHLALEKVNGSDSAMESIGSSDEWEWMVEMDWEA